MGLKLKRGNNEENTENVTLLARNKDFDGVKKDGGAIGPYGVHSTDLGLGLFDESEENNRPQDEEQESIELKLYSDEDPNDVFRLGKQEEEENGLRLSGQKDSADENKRDRNANPWDNPCEDYELRPRTISKAIDSRTYMVDVEEEHNPVLLISFIVVIALFAIEVITLGWVSSQNVVDVQFNLMKFQWIYSVVPIVVFVDAILVNVLYKKNIPLIIFAIILPFLYPLQRGKYTNGHSISGHLVCWGSLIAYVGVILLVGKAVNSYGGIIQVEDSTARWEAAALMEQEEDGMTVGIHIMQCLDVKGAAYSNQNGKEYVALSGYGTVYADGNSLVEQNIYDIPTVLTFVKRPAGQYALSSVEFGGETVSYEMARFYWEEAIK